MPPRSFQRARQPEQKRQRRQEILAAAVTLLHEQGFDAVSLNAIARHVGLAKSNVYRYFESREEIFLHLLCDDWEGWEAEVERKLAPLAGSNDTHAVARIVATTCFARPRMCQLISVLSSVLEQNLSEQSVVEFKSALLGLALRSANALHAAIPRLSVDKCGDFLRFMYALIAGLWPSSNPSPVVARVMSRPEFTGLQHDFVTDLEHGLAVLLDGLVAGKA